MNTEKEITIMNRTVKMRYCAAAETGYETISGKSSETLSAHIVGNDADGKPIIEPSKATASDYITLALAAITAAYAREDKEPPITSKDILYDCTPKEVELLMTTVLELRNEWYRIPATIPADEPPAGEEEEGEKPKN